jgi:glycosyltransferase involved in cell wall biosynthesis
VKVLFLEPFFGGSHRDFALGFKAHSRHAVDLMTMPARFWKWRMRGASLWLLNQIPDLKSYDAVLATDMMDLADFKSLAGPAVPPVLMYFHENQLSYPLSLGEKRDFHMGFTNIVSAAAADRVMFNSHFHFNAFMEDAGRLMGKLPDCKPPGLLEKIRGKSRVAYPGCRFPDRKLSPSEKRLTPPMVVWNHRWEHDKNPERFFDALLAVEKRNIPFSLAIMGENFEKAPPVFDRIKAHFENRLRVFGYLEDRDAYLSWLEKGAVVISTADQENFGISVVEAVRYGCLPLLPNRLSYPELIPESFHKQVLYESEKELAQKLTTLLSDAGAYASVREALSGHMAQFSWEQRIGQYDDELQGMQKKS